ncbi:DNA glycosylase [uncultured Dialister sp.]|uniref:DNA glycosylase n=1 Tax=uncultured Dialister sp. TaxID=278064 RepID=UPI0025FC6064|nr:DNA glycosylase [uncultured Dialister sp.]
MEKDNGVFRFTTKSHVLYIRHIKGIHYDVSCSRCLWTHVWKPYFDLSENYRNICNTIDRNDLYLQKAAAYSRGIRILKQDPWETMITFIISQRKSIPAISTSVEKLCHMAGNQIETPMESVYTFPSPRKTCRSAGRRPQGLLFRLPHPLYPQNSGNHKKVATPFRGHGGI